jgi:hypothetical protein
MPLPAVDHAGLLYVAETLCGHQQYLDHEEMCLLLPEVGISQGDGDQGLANKEDVGPLRLAETWLKIYKTNIKCKKDLDRHYPNHSMNWYACITDL